MASRVNTALRLSPSHDVPAALRPALRDRRIAAAVALLVMVGLALRAAPWLAGQPLHHDEALYGTWARLIATGRDPLLLTSWVDKPPLTLYLLAASLKLLGTSEIALRIPGIVAGVLLIATTYGFARTAWGRSVGLVAAALVAVSPFAVAFGPTAFTDGWLALWLVAAAWAALAGRPFAAGLLLGLAVASKQQGVLAAPLVLGLLALAVPRPRRPHAYVRMLGAAVLGFALVLVPLTWWDSLRWHNRPSFWDRSLQTYGGLAIAPVATWSDRAGQWLRQLGFLFGSPVASAIGLAGAVAAGVAALLHRRGREVDALLFVYLTGYLVLHVAVTFQPWDRYLLPVLPVICLLLARGIVRLHGELGRAGLPHRSALLAALGAFLLIAPLAAAVRGSLPIGSSGAVYRGVDSAAAFLRSQEPDAVIYYRRLGWHLDYYLFDSPQERRWYGDLAKLSADASATAASQPHRSQWLILPQWESGSLPGLEAALAESGLGLVTPADVANGGGDPAMTLYQIAPRHAKAGVP